MTRFLLTVKMGVCIMVLFLILNSIYVLMPKNKCNHAHLLDIKNIKNYYSGDTIIILSSISTTLVKIQGVLSKINLRKIEWED